MRRRQRPPPEPPEEPSIRRHISRAHRRFVQALVYVHFGSLVACAAAGLQARGGGPDGYEGPGPPEHGTSLPYFSTLVRSRPQTDPQAPNMSYFWQEDRSPHDICSHNGPNRTAYLNATYLFQKQHPISIWEVFSGSASARSDFARDDIRLRLKEGVQGDDCVHGSYNDCMRCFSRVRASIGRLSDAYAVFSKTLHRFDCMQAVDTATATRPFSPNGSCEHCKTWYGRWLLVHLVDVWERPPCINWCYYAQLACPHLATSKVVDYAGHPSFQCRDMHIPVGDALDAYSCNCVHPCDVRGVVSLNTSSRAGNKRSGNDFFAANEHCNARRRSCKNTAHDRMRTGNAGLRSSTNEALRPSIATTTQLLLASLLIGLFFGVLPGRP